MMTSFMYSPMFYPHPHYHGIYLILRVSLQFDVIYLLYYFLPHPYYYGTPLSYLSHHI